MQVTQVKVTRRAEEVGKIRGVASITLDDQFVVHGLRIIEGQRGLFVAMPGRRSGDGEFRDVAHPITSEMRNEIQTTVLQAYYAEL